MKKKNNSKKKTPSPYKILEEMKVDKGMTLEVNTLEEMRWLRWAYPDLADRIYCSNVI